MVKFIEKHLNNLLAGSGIVPLCKENVELVRAEKHQNSAQADNPIIVPQAQPIEMALLARAVYAKG
jgi:hypothetical protein